MTDPLRTLAPPHVDDTYRLKAGQFKDEVCEKTAVVLHHTVGGWLPFDYWNSDAQAVGTAYVVGADGTVYRGFADDRWAIHLFRRRKGGGESAGNFTTEEIGVLERRTIGVELVSWGVLRERPDGKLYHAYGKPVMTVANAVESGAAIRLNEPWREVQWWDGKVEPVVWLPTYPEPQIVGTIKLVHYLVATKGIPNAMPREIMRPPRRLDEVRQWLDFKGVMNHAMLRPDKTDTSPAFPYERLAHALNAKGW